MVTPSGTDAGDGTPVVGTDTPGALVGTVPVERLRFSSWSIVRALVIIALGFVALALVTRASTPFWWLSTAVVIAAGLQPAAALLRRWLPGWLAITVVVLGLLAVGGLLAYRGVDEVHVQVGALREKAEQTAHDLEGSKQLGQVSREFGLSSKVGSFFDGLPPVLGGGATADTVQTAASGASALFAIAMLTLLLLVSGRRFFRASMAQIDDPVVAGRVARLLTASYHRAARYTWLMVLRAAVVFVAVYVACLIAGFPAPTALAAWFAGWSLVPSLGLVVAAFPLTVTFAVLSPPLAVVVFGASVVIQVGDAVTVQAIIERRSVHLGPAVTLVAAFVGGSLYGAGGVLIAFAVVIFAMALLRELGDDVDDVPAELREVLAPAVLAGPAGPTAP